MNSQTSEVYWVSPIGAHQISMHPTSHNVIFNTSVATAIITAALTGAFTASVAVGSTPSKDVQYTIGLLNQAGYVASMQGTNLVISW